MQILILTGDDRLREMLEAVVGNVGDVAVPVASTEEALAFLVGDDGIGLVLADSDRIAALLAGAPLDPPPIVGMLSEGDEPVEGLAATLRKPFGAEALRIAIWRHRSTDAPPAPADQKPQEPAGAFDPHEMPTWPGSTPPAAPHVPESNTRRSGFVTMEPGSEAPRKSVGRR